MDPIITKPKESAQSADCLQPKLPPLQPSGKKPFTWARRQKATDTKLVLPVVELKKAAKLLAAMGKSIGAIEVMPHGGFRVEAVGKPGPSAPVPPPNPWDDLFNE